MIAQVSYEDCAKRNTLLEALVRDLYECSKYECNDTCPHHDTDTKKFCEFGPAGWLNERMTALGLLGGDAE